MADAVRKAKLEQLAAVEKQLTDVMKWYETKLTEIQEEIRKIRHVYELEDDTLSVVESTETASQ